MCLSAECPKGIPKLELFQWTGEDLNPSENGDFTRTIPFSLIFGEKKYSKGDECMIVEKVVNCPVCSSQKSYKDGIRYTRSKEIQRYLCRDCGSRFSWGALNPNIGKGIAL